MKRPIYMHCFYYASSRNTMALSLVNVSRKYKSSCSTDIAKATINGGENE